MHQELAVETLKTGEKLHIEVSIPPDSDRDPLIRPLLGHKSSNYLAHIEASMAGKCDELVTRYYIGLLEDGTLAGNIMTTEYQGVGILSHVHTRTDQRRKGVCQTIMRHQMDDFQHRDGKVLLLGTDYQGPAYWIYHSFGFRDSSAGKPGLMRYNNPADLGFESRFLAPALSKPAPAGWRHWPLVTQIAAIPAGISLRSLTLNVWDTSFTEGSYAAFLSHSLKHEDISAAVLESATGAVRAMAACVPDERWQGKIGLLDLLHHENVTGEELKTLAESLPLPSGYVQCYADPRDTAKISALKLLGFGTPTVLPGQFEDAGRRQDAWLFTRTI